MGPIRLRCALLFPMFGQIGKYRSRSAVLLLIGQHAAFGDRAEPMKVHARLQQIFRIQREYCILRSVITDPEKTGNPFAAVADSRPLDMRAGGIGGHVESEHAGGERAKAKDPSPSASAQ